MDCSHQSVRRLANGTIDYDFYRRRAMALRRSRIRYVGRRKIWRSKVFLRNALYAGAVSVGLIVGVTIPLGPTECRTCSATVIDVPPGAELDLLGATTLANHKVSNARPSID